MHPLFVSSVGTLLGCPQCTRSNGWYIEMRYLLVLKHCIIVVCSLRLVVGLSDCMGKTGLFPSEVV